jgi:hypothetical protein
MFPVVYFVIFHFMWTNEKYYLIFVLHLTSWPLVTILWVNYHAVIYWNKCFICHLYLHLNLCFPYWHLELGRPVYLMGQGMLTLKTVWNRSAFAVRGFILPELLFSLWWSVVVSYQDCPLQNNISFSFRDK